ncbi:MAG: hypothetical protein JWO63_890 [Frankiales bacterium]|nr:hypothetical protein [Frankiales bacterium]
MRTTTLRNARGLLIAGVLLLTLAACAGSQSSPGRPQATASSVRLAQTPATGTVILRPVDAAGRLASGYTLSDQPGTPVDCGQSSTASPSLAAVDDDILFCAPTALSATACWKASTPSSVLCLSDPFSTVVRQLPLTSPVPAVTAPVKPQPLGLLLDDGRRCSIRDGGAWNTLASHPGWSGWYSCDGQTAVWGPDDAATAGIDRSSAVWTVQVGPISGTGPVTAVAVKTAYLVGTASS